MLKKAWRLWKVLTTAILFAGLAALFFTTGAKEQLVGIFALATVIGYFAILLLRRAFRKRGKIYKYIARTSSYILMSALFFIAAFLAQSFSPSLEIISILIGVFFLSMGLRRFGFLFLGA